MHDDLQQDIQRQLEEAGQQAACQRYKLCLYVAGNTPRSMRAIESLRRIIEQHLAGQVDLEIVDIFQQVERSASEENLVATPMLVKSLPLPMRRLIGDLSNEDKVLMTLELPRLEGP